MHAYFGKSPSAYFGKTSCHTIEITASRARPRSGHRPCSMPVTHAQPSAAVRGTQPTSRPLAQQRAARRLDQLGVRGGPFVLHPRAAVDRIPGRQPRHGGVARVLNNTCILVVSLRATLIEYHNPDPPSQWRGADAEYNGPDHENCGALDAVYERNHRKLCCSRGRQFASATLGFPSCSFL